MSVLASGCGPSRRGMLLPSSFPSAEGRQQWRQSTIAVVPSINWGLARQNVHVTDAGEVWIVSVQWQRPFAEGTDFGGYFVGRVLPDGSVQRVSPDVFQDEGESCL